MRRNVQKTKDNKKFTRGNSRKPSKKAGSKFPNAKDEDMDKSSNNDPSWYSNDSLLVRGAASFTFSEPVGYPLELGTTNSHLSCVDQEFKQHLHNVPGIMTMHIIPSVGPTDSATSPLNIAATSKFSFVRHANSGSSEYDSPDMTLYDLALGNIYAFIEYCRRAYASMHVASGLNRYIPAALVNAQGIDYLDLRANLANFNYWLNNYIIRVSKFAVPTHLTYFKRYRFMYSQIYTEGDSVKDQLYMYVPDGFYKFEWDVQFAGKLTYVPLTSYLERDKDYLTVANLMALGEDLLAKINDDQDFKIMSGDILKAYGPSSLMNIEPVPQLCAITPVFDPMVLHQFLNATVMPIKRSSLTITQGLDGENLAGYLHHKPELDTTRTAFKHTDILYQNRVLSINATNPNPDMVIESTRLMLTYDIDSTDSTVYVSGGTEIADRVTFWGYDAHGGLVPTVMDSVMEIDADAANGYKTLHNAVSTMHAREKFKYAPELNIYACTDADKCTVLFRYKFKEVDNFSIMDSTEIRKLHDAALVSLFSPSNHA